MALEREGDRSSQIVSKIFTERVVDSVVIFFDEKNFNKINALRLNFDLAGSGHGICSMFFARYCRL